MFPQPVDRKQRRPRDLGVLCFPIGLRWLDCGLRGNPDSVWVAKIGNPGAKKDGRFSSKSGVANQTRPLPWDALNLEPRKWIDQPDGFLVLHLPSTYAFDPVTAYGTQALHDGLSFRWRQGSSRPALPHPRKRKSCSSRRRRSPPKPASQAHGAAAATPDFSDQRHPVDIAKAALISRGPLYP